MLAREAVLSIPTGRRSGSHDPQPYVQNFTIPGEHLSVISNTLLGDMNGISVRTRPSQGWLGVSIASFRAGGHHHRGGEPEFHAPGNAHFRGLAGSVRLREVMVLCRTVCRTEGLVRWPPQFYPLGYSNDPEPACNACYALAANQR